MLDIFLRLWDTIAPPHPTVQLLRSSTTADFRKLYQLRYIHGTVSLASYQNPLIKAAITANKFYNDTHAARRLSALPTEYLDSLPVQSTILIPIPLSIRREKERGYNQVARVLSFLSKDSFYMVAPLLLRTHDTKPQTTLHRLERLKNMQQAFRINPDLHIANHTRFIVIDDVSTTGATLQAAKETLLPLLPAESTLICLSLAH